LLTDDHGAGAVGVVAGVAGAEVDLEQVAGPPPTVRGVVVRNRRVRAGGDDRVEPDRLRPESVHTPLQVAGHLALGAPDERALQQLLQRLHRDPAGRPQRTDLSFVLDYAQSLDRLTQPPDASVERLADG